ncbi:5759_t:CDS:2 [Funneliformis mosseae]|uniref:5759_t:CDS:1 n=1 Tax=Funneliformis mosseae TaxID=27381 RepID=A0A9N9EJY5_FUNMO|nr:5759_t:CDS:2 [Funneliformis mosseae]
MIMEPYSNSFIVEATKRKFSSSSLDSKIHVKKKFTDQSTKSNSSKELNKDTAAKQNSSDKIIDQLSSFDFSLTSESFSAESNSNSNSLISSDIPSLHNSSTIRKHFLKNKINKGIISDINTLMDDGTNLTGYVRANPKRDRDYHNLFKEIPPNEYLINDYGCALQKEILAQGRIYVSLNYICFHAKIFGWVTNTVLSFSDVTAIEKKMTAFVIPNAILISTKKTKYFFASFLSRDTAYELFTKLWRHSKSSNNQNYLQVGHQNSDLEKTNEKLLAISLLKNKLITKLSLPNINVKKRDMNLAVFAAASDISAETEFVNNEHSSYSTPTTPNVCYLNRELKRSKSDEFVTKSSLGLQDNKLMHQGTICDCLKNNQHFDNIILDTKFKGSVEKIYNLLYTSGFITEILTDLEKSDDKNIGEWTEYNGNLVRQSSYTKRLNKAIINIGPKTTKCYVKDEVLHRDFEKYVTIMTSTKTPDVLSGNEFTIKTKTCIMWTDSNKTRVLVTCTFEFSKPTRLKASIEKASLEDQLTYYKTVEAAVRKYISQNLSEFDTSPTSSSIFIEEAKFEEVDNDDFYTIKQKSTNNKKTLHLKEEVTTTTSTLTNILSIIKLRVSNIETIVLLVIILTLIVNVYMVISLKDITHHIKSIEQNEAVNEGGQIRIEFDNSHYTLDEWLNELRKRQLFSILDEIF